MNHHNDFNINVYNPKFSWRFLLPQYWGTWVAVLLCCVFSFFPVSVRTWLAKRISKQAIKVKSKANRRARVNIAMCFPEKTRQEQESLLYQSYITSITFLLGFSSLTLRSKEWLEANTTIHGLRHLTSVLDSGDNVILFVPHTWAIDIPAILLASRGLPVCGMIKAQKNPLSDWLMHKQRVQYGGHVYPRKAGIKPFIQSIRKGYLGYYLPDEDLGPEHSVFVDFFATKKATMSGLGRLAKLSKAKVVPLFAVFDAQTGQYILDLSPPLSLSTSDEAYDARIMNECIENYVEKKPEQYMWILRLLKTRPDTNINPYK